MKPRGRGPREREGAEKAERRKERGGESTFKCGKVPVAGAARDDKPRGGQARQERQPGAKWTDKIGQCLSGTAEGA